MEEIIIVPIILISILIGIMFLRGKWTFLIAGVNTMSDEEKSKYNIDLLSKAMGKLVLAIAGILTATMFSETLQNYGGILTISIVIPFLIYINTNKKFKK